MSNQNIDWDTRNNDQDITFKGSSNSGETICPGCVVTLNCDDVTVFTHVDTVNPDQTFTGTIQGFQNWSEPEWNGCKQGTKVTFCSDNVFLCNWTAVAA